MERRKRIAVIVGQADEYYQSRFLTGFTAGAFALDMDVCVFSMYHKYQSTTDREQGEVNIFSLMRPEMFDGVVYLMDTVQSYENAQRLEDRLHDEFHMPVLVIELESKYFPSVQTRCFEAVDELVGHLIEVHGCKDIACLSGKRWHKHAIDRMRAVKDAMERRGLTLPEDRQIWGDFWYQSGEVCAEQLLKSEKGLPDAVVSADDAMAIGLCKGLAAHGIRIPEDIAVVSFDSTPEGQTSPSTITSSLVCADEIGSYSARFIFDKLAGREPEPFDIRPRLLIGESCGCTKTTMPELTIRRTEWGTDLSDEGFDSINNAMVEDLFAQNTLAEFLGTVYSYAYQLRGAESFHLCLCDCWKDLGSRDVTKDHNGYTENMIYAVRYNSDRMDGLASAETLFKTSELLPCLNEQTDHPRAFYFTPVFNGASCFGYAAVEYLTPRSYDRVYRDWVRMLMSGLEGLRRELTLRLAQETVNRLRSSKFSAAGSAYERIGKDEKAEFELVAQILDENLLTYFFQPIVDTSDGRIYSYEALMRTTTEKKISPLTIIKYADMQGRLPDVERATFLNVLKLTEENLEKIGNAKIFINSIPGVRLPQDDLAKVVEHFDRLKGTVVVELTEEAELSDEDLDRVKELLRSHGVKIAVDDYGTGYSNVSNLLRYMPDYVKIDRALLSEIQNNPQKQHFVREIINFCRDNGIKALAEGVETTEELGCVIKLGADLIQGYYTGRPVPGYTPEIDPAVREEIRRYRAEYLRGVEGSRYIAGKINRVVLSALMKDNITEIVVGQGAMIYKEIDIIGAPQVRANIRITVEPGYRGRITLQNANLIGSSGRPCISLAERSDVTLVLFGENSLSGGGIFVPEGAKLTAEGEGSLAVEVRAQEFFGIGTPPAQKAGELIFLQSGLIAVTGYGTAGCCIGGGTADSITAKGGRFSLTAEAQRCAGFGTFGDTPPISLTSCGITANITAPHSVGIGSLTGETALQAEDCVLDLELKGQDAVFVGRGEGVSVAGCECSFRPA